MKIYVASSWRNTIQPYVVEGLRDIGHDVYDFRNPTAGDNGFGWREIDPNWKRWSPAKFIESLKHPAAERGFQFNFGAMQWADACVLVLPCGRSAHLEAGWFAGAKKPLLILLDHGGHSYSDAACTACVNPNGCRGGNEPELMYKMATGLFENFELLCKRLAEIENEKNGVELNHAHRQ